MKRPLLLLVQVTGRIETFTEVTIEHLKSDKHKLPKLLFVFHVAFRYRVPIPTASLAKAEEFLQAMEFTPHEYKDLRGRR